MASLKSAGEPGDKRRPSSIDSALNKVLLLAILGLIGRNQASESDIRATIERELIGRPQSVASKSLGLTKPALRDEIEGLRNDIADLQYIAHGLSDSVSIRFGQIDTRFLKLESKVTKLAKK